MIWFILPLVMYIIAISAQLLFTTIPVFLVVVPTALGIAMITLIIYIARMIFKATRPHSDRSYRGVSFGESYSRNSNSGISSFLSEYIVGSSFSGSSSSDSSCSSDSSSGCSGGSD